jgi:hypothetical protein
MSVRVTVIIATYNWSSVLKYSIASVLRQTLADFELLVVGDGCTDDSESVVAGIGDPRIRWINLPAHTRHQSGPNNEGLRRARGEFIAYLGHDDLWLPHHLASLVAALDGTGADMAYALMGRVGPEGRFVWPTMPQPKYGAWAPPSCMVHRRRVTEQIGGWRDYRELNVEPDVELWRRAHAAGYAFTFVPRLTGMKFPAAWRPGVYRTRPCHEQAAWLARIESEPAFEAEQLAKMLADGNAVSRLPYREVLRQCLHQTVIRFRRRRSETARWRGLIWRRQGAGLDEVRRFKGL